MHRPEPAPTTGAAAPISLRDRTSEALRRAARADVPDISCKCVPHLARRALGIPSNHAREPRAAFRQRRAAAVCRARWTPRRWQGLRSACARRPSSQSARPSAAPRARKRHPRTYCHHGRAGGAAVDEARRLRAVPHRCSPARRRGAEATGTRSDGGAADVDEERIRDSASDDRRGCMPVRRGHVGARRDRICCGKEPERPA